MLSEEDPMLRRLLSLPLLVLILLAAACGDDYGPEDPIDPEPVALVEFRSAPDLLTVGQTARLVAITRNATGAELPDRDITWSSSNTAVAGISADGLVTAKAEGVTVLQAASEGKVARTTLHVTTDIVPVARVRIVEGEAATVRVGAALALHAEALAADGSALGGRTFAWRTSNGAVANVTIDGFVTGVAAGTARMTVLVEGQEAEIAVQVLPNVLRVEMNPEDLFLILGETDDIQARVIGDGDHVLDLPVTWTSSDESVATVSASGRVTTRQAGLTLIRATADGVVGTTVLVVGEQAGFELMQVNGQPVPADMFTRPEAGGTARYRAQAGELRIRDDGRYEQFFWFLVFRENAPMETAGYTTIGEWSFEEATGTYFLQDSQGHPAFTATRQADGSLRVTQRYFANASEASLLYQAR
jgi:uncharacterized protein YjdB